MSPQGARPDGARWTEWLRQSASDPAKPAAGGGGSAPAGGAPAAPVGWSSGNTGGDGAPAPAPPPLAAGRSAGDAAAPASALAPAGAPSLSGGERSAMSGSRTDSGRGATKVIVTFDPSGPPAPAAARGKRRDTKLPPRNRERRQHVESETGVAADAAAAALGAATLQPRRRSSSDGDCSSHSSGATGSWTAAENWAATSGTSRATSTWSVHLRRSTATHWRDCPQSASNVIGAGILSRGWLADGSLVSLGGLSEGGNSSAGRCVEEVIAEEERRQSSHQSGGAAADIGEDSQAATAALGHAGGAEEEESTVAGDGAEAARDVPTSDKEAGG